MKLITKATLASKVEDERQPTMVISSYGSVWLKQEDGWYVCVHRKCGGGSAVGSRMSFVDINLPKPFLGEVTITSSN